MTGARDDRDDPEGADDPVDALYDRYVEAALAGALESPEAFCAREGAPAELRARLEALFRLLHAKETAPADVAGAPGVAVEPGLPRERLGEFRLLRRLGEGGMGVVFLAEQESLRRLVALKLLRPELAGSPTAAERLRREAHAIAKLRHPAIVEVHAFGAHDGTLYCAMELVPGESLADRLRRARAERRPPPVAEVLRFAVAIARALDHAHRAGVLHRDVKPSNLRLTPDGRALLVDFGLAREMGSDAPSLTEQFVGSPAYASPEQITRRRDQVGPASDVWSLGATLFEALTLELPFGGDELPRLFHRILHEPPPSPRRLRPELPRDLEHVVLQCLEKEPARRYASAGALADDLEAVLELRPVAARPPGPWERARRWVRTHRVRATAAATLGLAAAAALAWRVVETRAEREAKRREAGAIVEQARRQFESLDADERELTALEAARAKVASDMETNYVAPERARLLDREGELRRRRRELALRTRRIEQLLFQVERLDPEADVRPLRAQLYLGEWRAARAPDSDAERGFLAGLVRANDPDGRHAGEIAGRMRVSIQSEPPGAEVFLFRYRPQSEVFDGGEYRLVPCPVGGETPAIAPGTLVLRVARDAAAADLLAEDVVVALDGRAIAADVPGVAALERARAGGRASVVRGAFAPGRGGRLEEVELPPGLELRPTGAPLLVTPGARVGATPIDALDLDHGSYLVLLRRPGCVPVRARFPVDPTAAPALSVELPPLAAAPPGCAWIASPVYGSAPFWIEEREVTAARWLEFVNDPATLAEIAAAARPVYVPRRSDTRAWVWPRGADGRFALPADVRGDEPVLGISFEDARAYAAWRNRVASLAAARLEWALPTPDEWRNAAHGHAAEYLWGPSFRAHWCSSCYARPRADPAPGLSFPIDESGYAVYDLAGSASEWCDGWFDDPSKELRWLSGGNWGDAVPVDFRAEAASGRKADSVMAVFGVRLVARRVR